MDNLANFINNTIKISDGIDSVAWLDIKSDKEPNFSVIISSYNTGKTIERTVLSVLNQTLKSVEVIVVDDASTDQKTLEKLKELEQCVKVIYLEENAGVSNARNVGIENSHAKYILCLDADDFIGDTYLEKAKNIFDTDGIVGVVSTGVQDFGESVAMWTQLEKFNIKELLSVNKVIAASCVRREIFDDIGGYDMQLNFCEDWEFWIRVFSSNNNWKIKIIQENLFYYFVHSDSVQHSIDSRQIKKSVDIILDKHSKLYKKYFKDIFSNIYIQYTKNRLSNKKLSYNIHLKNKQIQQKNREIQQKNREIQQKNREIQQKTIEFQQKNKQIQDSKSFKIGNLFFRSVKTPYKLVTYPYNFIKILLEK